MSSKSEETKKRKNGVDEDVDVRDAKRVLRHLYRVDYRMHKENRERLLKEFRNVLDRSCSDASSEGETNNEGFILLHGGAEISLYDTDTTASVFQQESNFQYLFGVKEPDCFGAIDVSTAKSYLFIPNLPAEYELWMGPLKSKEWFASTYGVDHVAYIEDMPSVFETSSSKTLRFFVLSGTNSDSGRSVACAADTTVFKKHFTPETSRVEIVRDSPCLYDVLTECRVFKSPLELNLMRYVTDVTSDAHMAILRHCKPGMREFQLESVFKHHCYYYGGCRHVAYTCICASGMNGAVLHYGHAAAPNDRKIEANDMCLFDMGAEFHRYASDVTCSFPAGGVFSPDQRTIYEIVLAAQWAVMDSMKPGVSWQDMHTLAYRVICTKLRDEAGIIREGIPIETLMRLNIGSLFMMHGLGHNESHARALTMQFIGLNVHDVGGYPRNRGTPARPKKDGYRSLRTARVLQSGMCLTVEPGIYFNTYAINRASDDQKRCLVLERLGDFKGFGGVRIEDVVVVTDSGIENLTNCPRTVSDIEAVMSGRISDRRSLVSKYYRKRSESECPIEAV